MKILRCFRCPAFAGHDEINVISRLIRGISCILLLLAPVAADACTAVIISGRVRPDGKPLMFKHRDTSNSDNSIEWFRGEKYAFLGLVNRDWRTNPVAKNTGGRPEVWSGRNEVGFCIINTATYDLKDDRVPMSEMDREGLVMYRALEICRTTADFEHFLDTLARPMGVEANFGVIDADGGAAWYEVNNRKWTKFDVNEEPSGYRVVTNFTFTGRKKDRKGVDRYEKACSILASTEVPVAGWDHRFLIDNISLSGTPILRDISASVIIFEGDRTFACLGRPDRVGCEEFYLPERKKCDYTCIR